MKISLGAAAENERKNRIVFLDGLRGIAIILVMLFHAYARWPNLYTYHSMFVGNYFLDTKIAGVRLFFAISGFVILMTLNRCRGLGKFAVRRWYRLFPAMLACSLFVVLTARFFPERPEGQIGAFDLLPGLTFSGAFDNVDSIWQFLWKYIGIHPSSIEGAFWSLYVEVRFYMVFGLAYFLVGHRKCIPLIFSVYIINFFNNDKILDVHFGPHDIVGNILAYIHHLMAWTRLGEFSTELGGQYYGWFTGGALFYLFHITRQRRFFWIGAAVLLAVAVIPKEVRFANLAVALLFIGSMSSAILQRILSNRVFIFMGFISYPLYLLHEDMMVAMIVKIGHLIPDLPPLLMPALPMGAVIAIAWIFAKYIEPATKNFLHTPRYSIQAAMEFGLERVRR